jgi:hypothetical protein
VDFHPAAGSLSLILTLTCSPAPTDGGPNFDTPTVCTSRQFWTGGDAGSVSMRPGAACFSCHDDIGRGFLAAGTVYPTAHEPDDCSGIDGTAEGTEVVLVGADGQSLTLAVNAAGNFRISAYAALALPFQARIRRQGKERAMPTPQTNGDCNFCHTERGAQGAPGRLVAP